MEHELTTKQQQDNLTDELLGGGAPALRDVTAVTW